MRKGQWSQERIAEALALTSEGLSASEVGRRMGVSRDAVLGQVWRARNPKQERSPRKPPSMPRESVSGERTVWTAWGFDEDMRRRAIWAKARRGAKRTRTMEATNA